MQLLDFGRAMFHNINLGNGPWLPRALVLDSFYSDKNQRIRMEGVRHVRLYVPNRIHVSPGQYVQVRFLDLGLRSFFQTHPFWVVVDHFDQESQSRYLDLLVQTHNGLTKRLTTRDRPFRVWISGPYGAHRKFEKFGTVLMFASGIGIAAYLAYIKRILELRSDSRAYTRSIVLVWQMSNLSEYTTLPRLPLMRSR